MSAEAEKMLEQTARVESVIWIPGAISDPDVIPESFEDFVGNLPGNPDAPLYRQLPQIASFADEGDYPDVLDVAGHLVGTTGFLIRAATPIMNPLGDGGAFHFSWGCYRTEWLYAKSESDILPVVTAWVESERRAERSSAA
ncbi:hypothetical protein ACFPOD_04800 [Nitratireductor kimnyeongensis]|uniref:Uncharacterized protein n=1 Tax=Nitratireductor kimnyeongensis TaxID=430679 RepID=A0ABW0T7J0_9HYPH|nr:hypothetical protein [Nitratireductor kimnyeongensis]QZZ34597.1 hypothetical protein KW403_12395 [Nitratireductor kimnyeongensis]